MLRPERMLDVTVLTRHEDTEVVISLLAQAKAMHLVDHKKEVVGNKEIDIGTPLASAEELSTALTRVRSLLSKIEQEETPINEPKTFENRIARVHELAEQYVQHEQKLVEIEHTLKELEKQEQLLQLPLPTPIEAIFKTKTVETIVAHKPKETISVDALFKEETETTLTVVIKKETDTKTKLKNAGYSFVNLAPLRGLHGTVDAAIRQVREHRTVAQHEKAYQKAQQHSFSKHTSFLKESEEILALELLKAQAPLHFGATKTVTLIKGFVPVTRMPTLAEQLETLTVYETKPAENAPTQLRNKIKSFEALIKLYTLPKYHEIDPTTVLAIAFPLFFGFMLGDIGYGLCLLLLFWFLGKKIPKIKEFAKIIMLSAVSTIIFGIIYGEIFGLEEIFGYHFHPLIHRAHELPLMFGIAIAVGVIHVNIGLLFGIINESREGWFFALIKKGSWMVLQAGIALIAIAYGAVGHLTFDKVSAFAVLGLGIAGILYGEKLQGLFELPTIVSHIMSYTRLVAVGLASVYMASVVNQLGGDLFAKGGAWILMGLFTIIVGHTINLALGLLGPFLHSLRLHYAEFFMKFYEGGGTPYVPFGEVMYGSREH